MITSNYANEECVAMQNKGWMTSFMFQKSLLFFKRYVPSGISQTNFQLLIMDGHGSHIIIASA
jgi:hypothetical protein